MSDAIEDQIAKIFKDAPTVEEHLVPFRAEAARLKGQLAEAKSVVQSVAT